jgi:hypothetical protein
LNRLCVADAAAMPLYQQLDLHGVTRRMVWKARGDEVIKGYDIDREGRQVTALLGEPDTRGPDS